MTGDQYQKITSGPQTLDFGTVFVKSTTVKTFRVVNDLRQSIFVKVDIDPDVMPEIANSTPLTQVIPEGQEAGFDIVFRAERPNNYNYPVRYFINGSDQPFMFLVKAKAELVSL